jgi:DNA-binding PadR family transcriptional regulator
MRDDLSALLPLSNAAFHILLVLSEGDCHGYSMSKKVEAATDGRVLLRPGTLYALLKQMLADGWIVEIERNDSDDARRRYYRLTRWGRRVAQAEAERLSELVQLARSRRLLPATATR